MALSFRENTLSTGLLIFSQLNRGKAFNGNSHESKNMKALVMGCGNIGSVAAEDLATSMGSTEVVVADVDEARAKIVARKIGASNVSWTLSDVMK